LDQLRRYRLSRGWSLGDVAQQLIELGNRVGESNLGVNADMVGRWERGEKMPRAPYPKLLTLLYGRSAEELGVQPSLSLRYQQRDNMARVDRTAVEVGVIPADISQDWPDWDELTDIVRKPARVVPEAVTAITRALGSLRRLDDLLGPRAALAPALAHRSLLLQLLESVQTEGVRSALLNLTAQLSQFLGWLAFDTGHHQIAHSWFNEALRLAHEVEDEALAAYILGYLSILVTYSDEPHEGLAFAEAAETRGRRTATPATASWLATVQAEVWATLGVRTAAEQALERGENLLGKPGAGEEPPWMYHYGQAGFASAAGTCYLLLKLPEPSRTALDTAITLSRAQEVREQAIHLTRLASTYVPEGEIEQACRIARDAVVIAEETRSTRALRRLAQFREQLREWDHIEPVENLDEQLAASSSWAKPREMFATKT
jgi:tetratricopeptide (TPR) repeat protein